MDAAQRNQIISAYPYPIALVYRTVTAIDVDEEPAKVLDYALETAEAVSRFLGVIALAELLRLKDKRQIEIPNAIRAELHKNLKRPSFGVWLSFAREGFTHVRSCREATVIPEMTDLFFDGNAKETEFKTALDKLIKLRNAIAHYGVSLDTESKQKSAANISLSFLQTVLERLGFFEEINFGYIRTIEVRKKARKAAVFQHKGKKLTGDNLVRGTNLTGEFSDFKETDAVIVRYDRNEYLNLHPFYVYEEACADAADIFYFNGQKGKRLEYVGIGPGGKFYVEAREEEADVSVEEQFDLLMDGSRKSSIRENVKCSLEMHREFDHVLKELG